MKENVQPPYGPIGGARELFKCKDSAILFDGPAGCVRGDTVLTGSSQTIQYQAENNIKPLVLTKHGVVEAEVPFLKGIDHLYEVVTENGSSIIGTWNHRVLTASGWTNISELSVGMELLSSLLLDDYHLKKTTQDCQDHCSHDYRQYGEQLLSDQDSDQASSPLPNDAQKLGYDDFYEGGPGNKYKYNHIYQQPDHLSKKDYLDPSEQNECVGCCVCQETYVQSHALNQSYDQFQIKNNPQQPSLSILPGASNNYQSSSYNSPFDCYYSIKPTKIKEINYKGVDKFYDLHVPKHEHYHCNGLWHHNTGKSRAVLEKINLVALKYDNCRILLCRETRASMTQSILVTYEEKVLPPGFLNSSLKRANRSSYKYPNGSEVVIGGMDNAERIMSTEYDVIAVFEASETDENDFELLTTRLRNAVVPYQQIICDTNPTYPQHYLFQYYLKGKMTRIRSRHEDNPTVTKEYLEQLSKLEGHRRNRLYLGKWVSASGVIYERFDEKIHVTDINKKKIYSTSIISIDAGYTNPCSIHTYGMDGDGNICVIDEWVKTQQLEPQILEEVKRRNTEKEIHAVIIDPSAATLKAAIRNLGMNVIDANNDVYSGINKVQEYLEVPKNNIPKLQIDTSCTNLIQEFNSYCWDPKKLDRPVKINDHSMDELRYAIMYFVTLYGSIDTNVYVF